MASSSIAAANATRGDGVYHAHQLFFTGSAATRACTRRSNASDGSISGNSSVKPDTARNSFTRRRHAGHAERCFSTSCCSLAFSRPSTYGSICFSTRLQFITLFLPIKLHQIFSFQNLSVSVLSVAAQLFRLLRHQRRQLHSQRLIRPEQQ